MANNGKSKGQRVSEYSTGSSQQNAVRRRNRGQGFEADWSAADSKLLLRLISSVCKIGGAVQFGYTRAKDQYVIRILGDGEPYNEYLRPTEDVDLWLEGFCQDYEFDGTRPDGSAS